MWKITFVCLCLCALVLLAEGDEQESKLVNLAQGPVRGYKDPDHGIFSFFGIPYATAPTGPNKFKAPLPPPVWTQPYEAINKAIICPQQGHDHLEVSSISKLSMKEDCLIANVYIPDTEETNLPVVVYIHGGAFVVGWGTMLEYEELVSEQNVIVVTFNYRLGIHGFLCLGTEDVPGNAGLKDQLELLRWVNRNIASFGGNPEDVTLAGYSAGSASVDFQMLSKSSEGLFNKVIPESGVSTAVFALQFEPLENAKLFARMNNFDEVDDIDALEQFYKTASFKVLNQDAFMDRPDSTFVFSPCVERPSDNAFLVETTKDILDKNSFKKVPILYGFTNMEGFLRLEYYESWKNKMNEKFSDFLPADLQFESEAQKEEVAQSVKEFYFGDMPVGNENILSFVDYFSDVIFLYSSLRAIKTMVANGHDEIYFYEYSFVDENTNLVPYTDVKGAEHCAQSEAIAGQLFDPSETFKPTEEFIRVSTTMRQLWGNFIKTGKPVPEGSSLPAWPAVLSGWSPHMAINDTMLLTDTLLERRFNFWDDIYSKYTRTPQPPPENSSSSTYRTSKRW